MSTDRWESRNSSSYRCRSWWKVNLDFKRRKKEKEKTSLFTSLSSKPQALPPPRANKELYGMVVTVVDGFGDHHHHQHNNGQLVKPMEGGGPEVRGRKIGASLFKSVTVLHFSITTTTLTANCSQLKIKAGKQKWKVWKVCCQLVC